MNCRKARSQIALWIGDDLEEPIRLEIERHLAFCPDCRDHWKRMKVSLQVLHDSGEFMLETPCDSVWPGLATRLQSVDRRSQAVASERLVPAIAVIALCLAMISLFRNFSNPVDMQNGLIAAPVTDSSGVSPYGSELSFVDFNDGYRTADDPTLLTPHEIMELLDRAHRREFMYVAEEFPLSMSPDEFE